MPVLYKLGRKLVGDHTAKSRLKVIKITEFLFADDATVYICNHSLCFLESCVRV